MKRFVINCNIERFQRLIDAESDAESLRRLEELIAAERRALALLLADEFGAAPPTGAVARVTEGTLDDEASFLQAFRTSPSPMLLIDPGPRLQILDVNAAAAAVAGRSHDDLVGQPFFEAFPENPDDPQADGVSRLMESLQRAAATGRPDVMGPQRYDLMEGDAWVAHYWLPHNTPVFDEAGELRYIVHESREATGPNPSVPATRSA